MPDFSGTWWTTFGQMTLTQQGDQVDGSYTFGATQSLIQGRVEGNRFTFRYQEPAAQGEGYFELLRSGKFTGKWRPEGAEDWAIWTGERGYEGIWNSTFGLVRLIQDGQRVQGFYEGLGSSTIEGRLVNDRRLEFTYQEPQAQGEGSWELAEDELNFTGQWRATGQTEWRPWEGGRRQATPGVTWLVVIEAHWQNHLLEREYSFGNMLKEFFARVPSVQFRHRYFNDANGLLYWCRDLMYLSEPVVALVATHATANGLAVRGELVAPDVILDGVRHADNLKLLHFSSCLMMSDGPASNVVNGLLSLGRFPVSGYTTSVDWAASAILEFTYLDMILARGLSPETAAQQILSQLRFAGEGGGKGDTSDPNSPYPPAGFRLLLPPGK